MATRFIPIINCHSVRLALGFVCAACSPVLTALWFGRLTPNHYVILAMVAGGWLPAVLLTDKYVHKYPQRYYTYLQASHLKAALILALAYLVIWLVAGSAHAPLDLLAFSLLLFVAADALISVPRRRKPAPAAPEPTTNKSAGDTDDEDGDAEKLPHVAAPALIELVESELPAEAVAFLREHLPAGDAGNDTPLAEHMILNDLPDEPDDASACDGMGLLAGRTRLNSVRRLNMYLQHCTRRIAMGGYLLAQYTPLDAVIRRLRERHPGFRFKIAFLIHFLWYRAIPKIPWLDRLYFSPLFSWLDRFFLRKSKLRTRVLSTAEVWGRLAYYGMEVVAESDGEDDRYILARRVTPPVTNKKPSYYAIVALEKVGLDGKIIRLHKARSMYPFSEFLQKRIFESHGLSATGKFKNDPRLTEYAKMIRSKWIDEIPGIFDWLRGDIKLVGMRATSPHFLSLYPQELYDLYSQIEPGLVPPIFDESTGGFEEIVEVEMTYLKRYLQAPIKTDILYFWYTFRDIVFRKVRSK